MEEEDAGFHPAISCDECNDENKRHILLVYIFGSVFLGIWLIVGSVGTVIPLTYGIRYNAFTKYADTTTVYGPGRHLIGPFNSFIVFPATVQSIEFSNEQRLASNGERYPALHSRTKEGLALHLQVSLQYQLIPEKVGQLCGEFNQEYKEMFISTIRDTLIRAASDYEAFQLWEMRGEVGHKMQGMVNRALERVYARCWGLQLMVIELPKAFDDSIVATQVQRQKISTMQFQQSATIWRAQTSVIAAEFGRQVKVIKARGKANYTLQTRCARGQAKMKVLNVETEMIDLVRERLQLVAGDLVKYQQYSALTTMPNASVFFGFDENSQVLLTSSAAPAHAAAAAKPPQAAANATVATTAGQASSQGSQEDLIEATLSRPLAFHHSEL